MDHTSQLVHIELDLFVSDLITYPVDVTGRRAGVMDLHTVCAAIENLLHRTLAASDHIFIHHRGYQR